MKSFYHSFIKPLTEDPEMLDATSELGRPGLLADLAVRSWIRGTLGDIDPLNKVERARSRVKKGPL